MEEELLSPASSDIVWSSDIQTTIVTTDEPGDFEFDQVTNRIQNVKTMTFPQKGGCLSEVRKRHRRHDLSTLKEIWVITDFSELHDQVHQCCSILVIADGGFFNQLHDANLISQIAVICSLTISQITINVFLDLVTKFFLHMLFDSAQHERLQDHV